MSIISQQMIEDQRITTLPEAMTHPGHNRAQQRIPILNSFIRAALALIMQIDGASPMDIGTGLGTFYSDRLYDMAAYDHVEVLRGARWCCWAVRVTQAVSSIWCASAR